MSRNALILIDSAPNYVEFFKVLNNKVENKINFIYACESHFSEVRCNSFIETDKKYYFSQFDKVNIRYEFDEINKMFNLRKGYFPDFDRHEWYKENRNADKTVDDKIMNLINFFVSIIEKENIEFVIYENVSNVFSYCAYIAAKLLNKKYIGFIVSRIKGRFDMWFDLYGNIEKIKYDFEHCNLNEVNEPKFLDYYYKSSLDKKPEYLKEDNKRYNINYFKYYLKKIKLLKFYIYYNIHYRDERKESIEVNNAVILGLNSIRRNMLRKIKINYLNLFNKRYFYEPNSNENYALYPLHFQPESSTSVNAMYFLNQYEVIRNIAFSLPVGMYLYVKDHPHAFGYFTLDFYKKLRRIPNVRIIHCDADTGELMKRMKFLVTLTGTMGYEALLHEKPVISFGKVFYNVHPYCFNINNYDMLFDTVNKILHNEFNNFDEYNIKLIYAYLRNTYDGRLVMNDYKKSSMDKISKGLIDIIEMN